MNSRETKLQELGRRLVDREVYYCVSSLMSDLTTLVSCANQAVLNQVSVTYEDMIDLNRRVDYDEAAEAHIDDCDDLDDLEAMADFVGDWSDALRAAGYDTDNAPFKPIDTDDPEAEPEQYDDPADYLWDLEEEEGKKFLKALRTYIKERVDDHQKFCHELDIDADEYESDVYEHWIVSNWLARKLAERGEVTGDVCGMTIWGRCTTGQAISMDYVIQQIAAELWSEELESAEQEASDDSASVLQ